MRLAGFATDKNGKAITAGVAKPVEWLRDNERAMYLRVLDLQHTGHRRLEQERIPLERAREAVERIVERAGPGRQDRGPVGRGPG